MSDPVMMAQICGGAGFVAALDQSGGSTPKALKAYGVPADAWSNDNEMFQLIHDMRVRIITAPNFDGRKVLGAILFERTMDGSIGGVPIPGYLWKRGVVPFLKIDKGLEAEADGVQLMKPIAGLDPLLDRAAKLGVFGTKMRSVVNLASPVGIAAIVKQQFEIAEQILAHDLTPIIEPEVLITSSERAAAEAILRDEIARSLDAMQGSKRVMLKLTIPEQTDLYAPLAGHMRVARVLALSGGFSRTEAGERLSRNHGMIASFSRALLGELRHGMDDATFNTTLGTAVDETYASSAVKAAMRDWEEAKR